MNIINLTMSIKQSWVYIDLNESVMKEYYETQLKDLGDLDE